MKQSSYPAKGLSLQAQSGEAKAAHHAFTTLLASFIAARIGLAIPALLGIILSSLWYTFVVGLKPGNYPRRMAINNPLVFLLLIVILVIAFRPLGLVLAPPALNMSHLLFFIFSTARLTAHPPS